MKPAHRTRSDTLPSTQPAPPDAYRDPGAITVLHDQAPSSYEQHLHRAVDELILALRRRNHEAICRLAAELRVVLTQIEGAT